MQYFLDVPDAPMADRRPGYKRGLHSPGKSLFGFRMYVGESVQAAGKGKNRIGLCAGKGN